MKAEKSRFIIGRSLSQANYQISNFNATYYEQAFDELEELERLAEEYRMENMRLEEANRLCAKSFEILEPLAEIGRNQTENEYRFLKNFITHMPKTYRKRNVNWVIVKNFLMCGTSTGGRASSIQKCIELGIDPDGYNLERR